jgi:phage shock protein E
LINCNDAKFEQNLSALDKSKPVFVYCAVGGRSSKAAQVLNKNGFKVYNLTGAGYGQLAVKGL